MRLPKRNTLLAILFIVIQYQLWFSPYGFSMKHALEDEVSLLSKQVDRMTLLTKSKSKTLDPEVRGELLDEQAREVYHYIGSDEIFVPNKS